MCEVVRSVESTEPSSGGASKGLSAAGSRNPILQREHCPHPRRPALNRDYQMPPGGGGPPYGGPRRGKSWPVPPRGGPPDAPAGAADQGALVGASASGEDSPPPSVFGGAGCPAAPLPGVGCTVAGRALPPEPQEPPGTSCRLGSKPLFSAFLLGKFMGFGTAMMGPALRTPPPRTADDAF